MYARHSEREDPDWVTDELAGSGLASEDLRCLRYDCPKVPAAVTTANIAKLTKKKSAGIACVVDLVDSQVKREEGAGSRGLPRQAICGGRGREVAG